MSNETLLASCKIPKYENVEHKNIYFEPLPKTFQRL